MAGETVRVMTRAQAANVSNDEVMSVGRKRVTPVFRIAVDGAEAADPR